MAVHAAETPLPPGVSLIGSSLIPFDSLLVVALDHFALVVPKPQLELGLGRVLLGRALAPVYGHGAVDRYPLTFGEDSCEFDLRVHVAVLGEGRQVLILA